MNALISQLMKWFGSFPRLKIVGSRVWRTKALGLWAKAYNQQALTYSYLEMKFLNLRPFSIGLRSSSHTKSFERKLFMCPLVHNTKF